MSNTHQPTTWSELTPDQQRYAIGWLSATAPDQLADAIANARTFDTRRTR